MKTRKKRDIPKIIHLYWHTKELPLLIQQCKQTMIRMNPGWEIIQYSHEDLMKVDPPAFCNRTYHLPHVQLDAIKYACDWFRLYVLYKHGGVYMDMSCICLAPLDSFLDMHSASIQGYNMSFLPNFYCMENWFICAPPKHEFIHKWMKETAKAHHDPYGAELKYSEENYEYGGVVLQRWLPYLVQALAWKKINTLLPEIEHRMIMGCTDKRGPYFWDNLKGTKQDKLRQLFRMTQEEFKHIPLLKLNQGVRDFVQEMIPKFKNSFLVKHLEFMD